MILEKMFLLSVILVSLSQLTFSLNDSSIDGYRPVKVKITTLLDVNLDEYEQQFKHNDEFIVPSVPGTTDTHTSNDVCATLVGTSKGKCCPVNEQQSKHLPRNCKEIQETGHNVSGIYTISPYIKGKSVKVVCDMETRGGGWTHIQKRFDGSEDFYRNWREYKFGFGNLHSEFWMGLENIHHLTVYEANELLVELTDKDNVKHYAHYTGFAVGPEVDGYVLKTLSGFSGNTGDSLQYQVGQEFTTFDLDQDQWDTGNCAEYSLGGWWYNNCYSSNLNGKLRNMKHTQARKRQGMNWDKLSTNDYFLSGTRMLVKPNH